jgi:hypothetical protein
VGGRRGPDPSGVPLLFTDNETYNERLCPTHSSAIAYLKDGNGSTATRRP